MPWTTIFFQLEKNTHFWPFIVSIQKKLQFQTIFLNKKCVAENTTCVNEVCILLSSCLLTFLLSIPFDKLPCFQLRCRLGNTPDFVSVLMAKPTQQQQPALYLVPEAEIAVLRVPCRPETGNWLKKTPNWFII